MDVHNLTNPESDPRFPSGPWTGFFLQYWLPGRHPTNVRLTCRDGELTGTGQDWVGPYTVTGSYDPATGRCEWTKKYHGKHSVEYRGVNEGRGIWGVWEIRQLGGLYIDRGGFHMWPEGSNVSEESDQTEEALLVVMRGDSRSRRTRVLCRLFALGVAVASGLLIQWLSGY